MFNYCEKNFKETSNNNDLKFTLKGYNLLDDYATDSIDCLVYVIAFRLSLHILHACILDIFECS